MTPLTAGLTGALMLVAVAVLLVGADLAERRTAERLRRTALGAAPPQRRPRAASIGQAILRGVELSGVVRFFSSAQDRSQVERSLAPLGVPFAMAAPLLVITKLVCLVGGPAAGFLYFAMNGREGSPLMPVVVGLGIGVVLPNLILAQLRKAYLNSMNRAMSDTLDLLVVCAEAGLGLESAIDRVAADLRRSTPAMAMEFAQLSQEMRMLPDRSQAMERFAERAEVEGLRRLAATLAQAMRYGTPLGQALRTLAAEQRQERMIRLEEKAAKLPATLVMPLILFVLPPLFMVLVGPSLLDIMDTLGGNR
jgi:tight adherence protein C